MSNYVWWPDQKWLAAISEDFLRSEDPAAQPFGKNDSLSLKNYLRSAMGRAARQWAENRRKA